MISQETIEALEHQERGWQYILGARMRSQNEVKDEVLSRAGRYRIVHPKRPESKAPSPLDVKEVWVDERRYIISVMRMRPARMPPIGRRSSLLCGSNSAPGTSR
jgi:hypothetical protein